ncbi:MAG: hypothetical protein JWR01_1345 [Subtercola sp.]|nr:hypothetical protein [Subtercola sp.]
MSAVTASRPSFAKPATGGSPAAASTASADRAGRTRITARALNRLLAAVSAEALGVDTRTVTIDLADESGRLSVTVRSPLRVVSLSQVTAEHGIVARTGGTILERAQSAQQQIRSRAAELSGSDISTVTVRLTGIDIQPERRVS